ncbi:MAG: amino acid transporter [Pirellulales bacterium]|nr:amino acid transporter [Pirellulales bacterium]
MTETPRDAAPEPSNPWPLVLCLVGVDYFSTLSYLPSIAVQAAGPLAPVAAGAVVLVTFLLALPVYWYVVGRSRDGRGGAGLLEDLIPGWRGKLVVLTLLGFAAADFVITRSLSLAVAAGHIIHNPHGRDVVEHLPTHLALEGKDHWPPLQWLLDRVFEPQVAVTLILSIFSFGLWQLLKHGVTRRALFVLAGAVSGYLAVTAVVIVSAVVYLTQHAEIWVAWRESIFAAGEPATADADSPNAWIWAWLSVALWTFPQMALGLSGLEMIMTVVPGVSGGRGDQEQNPAGRSRNTRKLMVASASIMAVYLVSAVVATTLLVPREELQPGGAAEHRALSYLAHGSPLADGYDGAMNPLLGEAFGDLFDFSTVLILCLAGATVTMGLQRLVPHYLNRLGMEVSWAGRVGVILLVLNVVVLVLTVVFRASPSSQQWAYAASVLMLLAGTALAAATDLGKRSERRAAALPLAFLSACIAGFFLLMTGLTVYINHSGLTIAMAFVAAILISSIVSRWIRSTELRFEGFDFSDEATRQRWEELGRSGPKVLAPHRPGLISLEEKSRTLQHEYRLDPAVPVIFVEAELGDPSNFYQKPMLKIEREGALEVIRVSKCVSISHVLAAIALELCRDGGAPPEIVFGWSNEPPLAANLNFLLLGEGNIPWMVKELVRRAVPDVTRQPRIVIG